MCFSPIVETWFWHLSVSCEVAPNHSQLYWPLHVSESLLGVMFSLCPQLPTCFPGLWGTRRPTEWAADLPIMWLWCHLPDVIESCIHKLIVTSWRLSEVVQIQRSQSCRCRGARGVTLKMPTVKSLIKQMCGTSKRKVVINLDCRIVKDGQIRQLVLMYLGSKDWLLFRSKSPVLATLQWKVQVCGGQVYLKTKPLTALSFLSAWSASCASRRLLQLILRSVMMQVLVWGYGRSS